MNCGLLVWIFGSEVFFSWKKASRPSRKRKFESMIFLFQVGQDMYRYVLGVAPSQDSSDHQDYYIFSRDPHKPSYATVAGTGTTPEICCYLVGCMPCWWFLLLHFFISKQWSKDWTKSFQPLIGLISSSISSPQITGKFELPMVFCRILGGWDLGENVIPISLHQESFCRKNPVPWKSRNFEDRAPPLACYTATFTPPFKGPPRVT